jgi:NADPH-dependent 7-cyano-7-deazaguanine reductase QueF-like protein
MHFKAMLYLVLLLAIGGVTTTLGRSSSPNERATNFEEAPNCVPSSVTNPATDSEDRLSDQDILFLKSHKADYWRAADQDTLKQVLLMHRHGDRTPINLPAQKDNLNGEHFWTLHGLGQLTNRGKERVYALGKIIRQRYDHFLGSSSNKSFRKSRASGAMRCIESAQVFLASFLAPGADNSEDGQRLVWGWQLSDRTISKLWQPASVTTLAAKYDGMLNEASECKALAAEYEALDESEEAKLIQQEFKHEREVLEREYGLEFDHFDKWAWASSLLEIEHSYFGQKMKPAVLAVHERVQLAGNRAMALFQTRLKMRRARVGLLINDIIKNMDDMRRSSESIFNKRFVHYSAHDMNLVFMLGALDNIDSMKYRPDYASNIIFELHEDNGEWFVKLFYTSHVPSRPIELHMEACERGHELKRCTLDKFTKLMEKYRVSSWWDWMQECGNPVEGMDPYAENA